ncbi:uncharacterized protein si:ch211-225b11.4 [Syngnathoides biaculeatus]|uniref:uncharacterized protein si:ch211-225b11.4 n=1 Tax=Syngnathoides biaculeatus TaxID=300417 RepID=UPI002ADDB695|nr:uncharacterized protein si:ch211-225b11.4 [Syngnathoides biaculeatus]
MLQQHPNLTGHGSDPTSGELGPDAGPPAGSGARIGPGRRHPSVCARHNRPGAHDAQFSPLGHEKSHPAALQFSFARGCSGRGPAARELRETARDLQRLPEEARLRLQPSLYRILTLLSQLQPGVQDSEQSLADFLPPLLQLSASPIYGMRAMASKALVAMTPPSEHANIFINLTAAGLPGAPARCCRNWLHGQLLHTKALLDRALAKKQSDLKTVLYVQQTCQGFDTSWIICRGSATEVQAVASAVAGESGVCRRGAVIGKIVHRGFSLKAF